MSTTARESLLMETVARLSTENRRLAQQMRTLRECLRYLVLAIPEPEVEADQLARAYQISRDVQEEME